MFLVIFLIYIFICFYLFYHHLFLSPFLNYFLHLVSLFVLLFSCISFSLIPHLSLSLLLFYFLPIPFPIFLTTFYPSLPPSFRSPSAAFTSYILEPSCRRCTPDGGFLKVKPSAALDPLPRRLICLCLVPCCLPTACCYASCLLAFTPPAHCHVSFLYA